MQLNIRKKIGRETYSFLIEGEDLYDCVTESQKLSFPNVDKCGLCGSETLSLQSRLGRDKDTGKQTHKYVFIKCWLCKGELTFGHRKDDGEVYYLRKNDNGNYMWRKFEEKINE